MARSYRRLHYGLRPAKNVERKLIVEALSRLDHLHPLREFRYVGLGSLYFVDFALFHRRLGFTEMVSIEDQDNPDVRARFEFNRPFGTRLVFGRTTDVLGGVLVEPKPTVAWLDYDGSFTSEAIIDLETVVQQATPPTVVLVTVNVEPGEEDRRRERFEAALGARAALPENVRSDADLGGGGQARAVRDVMNATISASLADVNAALYPDEALEYRELFNFRYQDGARMATFGGLLYRADQADAVAACRFEDLEFCATPDEPFDVDVPTLTLRETMAVDQSMPFGEVDVRGLPPSDLANYRRLYRHLPAWIDAEL